MPAAARQSAKQHRPHSRRGIGGVPNALFVMAFGVGDGLVVMRRIEQRTNSPPLIYQYDGALIGVRIRYELLGPYYVTFLIGARRAVLAEALGPVPMQDLE